MLKYQMEYAGCPQVILRIWIVIFLKDLKISLKEQKHALLLNTSLTVYLK